MIYLAIPYSHEDPRIREQRFLLANKIAGELLLAGFSVFSPISHTHPISLACDLPTTWGFWEKYDKEYLERCAALVVITAPGWRESVGVTSEIRIARELKLPILFMEP